MLEGNYTLGSETHDLIQSRIGVELDSVQGYALFEQSGGTMFAQVVRLCFNDDVQIDVRNALIPINIVNDVREDIGVLSVEPSAGDIWHPEDQDIARICINQKVLGIALVNDHDIISCENKTLNELSFTQAIAFDLGESLLVLDKDSFTEDFILLRSGTNINSLVKDCDGSWYEGENITDQYFREIEWLS